ncbi:AraC family transcriptional regulator [Lignipirellula cremea]|uniref:AraC family transcriptional regulator n=1 Tax=Lignipirellula cremea TaxID=2528010 RepID=UPI0028F416FB|nr:DNA-binding transcriptional regulator [Lignipirellula cremea]
METSRSYGRDLLRGIALFARTRSNWSLLHQEMTIDVLLPEWMQESAIHGVIARVDTRTIEPLRRLGVPCVDVRCSRSFPGIPQVETDDQKVAALAFEHLWDRGFRRFAFCGFQFAHYSDARLRFFQKLVVAAGCPLSVYETPGRRDATLSSLEESGVIDAAAMSAWLKSLTSPTGLFVCNDIRGQQVLNACRTLDLAVPDDVAVIGVDDDDAVCPLSDPPLTSVRPDAERAGYRAAEILDAMMNGEPAPARVEYIPPTTVVQRMSTQVMAVEDREVARVCRFIREHACDGIDVNDVTEFTSLSRRQLERRFRTELNRTLHEEITAARLTRVKQLLQETRMTLEQIAPLAGFSHKESLSAVFKRDLGETPGEYRRRIISHGE